MAKKSNFLELLAVEVARGSTIKRGPLRRCWVSIESTASGLHWTQVEELRRATAKLAMF